MWGSQRYLIRKPVALIGFMAAGKTSVAKLLEEHTGIKRVDTDEAIVQYTRQTISEIINNQGEEEFRRVEAKILGEHVEKQKLFIATGGGVIESAVSRGILKQCYCIWLKVDAKTSAKRIGDVTNRPLFIDFEHAEKLLARRNEIYEQYSDFAINTNNKPLSDVVREAQDHLLKVGILQY